jgi:hypothetical protein
MNLVISTQEHAPGPLGIVVRFPVCAYKIIKHKPDCALYEAEINS